MWRLRVGRGPVSVRWFSWQRTSEHIGAGDALWAGHGEVGWTLKSPLSQTCMVLNQISQPEFFKKSLRLFLSPSSLPPPPPRVCVLVHILG